MADNSEMATDDISSDMAKKMGKAQTEFRGFSFRRIMTPFTTACIALLLLLSFNFLWATLFGNKMGGNPYTMVDINWVRPEVSGEFTPNFNGQNQFVSNGYKPANQKEFSNALQKQFPRITASNTSKIIHLTSTMSEELAKDFATTGKLIRAPIREVVQFSKFGQLPKIGVLGEKPSDVYARPAPQYTGKPQIAIMITGLGIHHQATKTAIDTLPGEISFAFSPYGDGLQDWINRSRDNGHEIILQTPMEPFDFPDNDPGPSTLLSDASYSVNMNRLKWVMSRVTGYIGITNFMGDKFTSKEKAVAPILKELKNRGLYFIENGILHRSKVGEISEQLELGLATVDIIIDGKHNVDYIENSFDKIEKLAQRKGIAFAIGSNLPVTIERLKIWVNKLEAKGFQLIPVSAKIKQDMQVRITAKFNTQ